MSRRYSEHLSRASPDDQISYLSLVCRERRNKNEDIFQEKLMFSSQNDTEFHAITSDVLTSSKSNTSTYIINLFPKRFKFPNSLCCPCSFSDSLILDREARNMMESVSTTLSDHLKSMNEKHSEGTESIRNIASNRLEKDYMVSSEHLFRLEVERQLVAMIYKIIRVLMNCNQTKLYHCCLAEN